MRTTNTCGKAWSLEALTLAKKEGCDRLRRKLLAEPLLGTLPALPSFVSLTLLSDKALVGFLTFL